MDSTGFDVSRELAYRNRTLVERVFVACFFVFLVGFITVLCVGNYCRAKRAQERQRQRRLAKLAAANNANQGMYAPDANYSASYEAPAHVPANGGVQA
eukprot:Nitzschia sp. Nitz4//scaffold56_size114212//40843//41213//NITZ4_003942-RA/size114212-processed-gene-0.60-mRNA-1//-1//CDS//3329554682//8993//frame0